MAKGQKRSNKEIKKPKQQKPVPSPTANFEKGLTAFPTSPKKKG